MPDIKCSNPVCQLVNPDTRTFCSKCGWRLPKTSSGVDAPKDLAALQAAYSELEQQNHQLVLAGQAQKAQLDKVAADHAELAAMNQNLGASQQELQQKHDALATSNQDLTEKHQVAVTTLSDAQQQIKESESWKQRAADEIDELRTKLKAIIENQNPASEALAAAEAEISKLTKLLKEAQTAYESERAKVNAGPVPVIVKATWPLSKKVILGLLGAIVGSAGGATAGIYSPLNPARKALSSTIKSENQQVQSIASVSAQLKQAKDDLEKSRASLAAEQQSNGQLTQQVNSLNQGSQTATHQMSTVQSQLTTAKAETAKEHAEAVAVQQELQAEKGQVHELSQKAALLTSLQATIAAHPYLSYKGPMQGIITIKYSGKNDKPAAISLDHFSSTADSGTRVEAVSGLPLPGVPVVIEPLGKNVSVISPPAQSNSWQKMTLSVQGKGSNTVTLRWTVF